MHHSCAPVHQVEASVSFASAHLVAALYMDHIQPGAVRVFGRLVYMLFAPG